MTTGKLLATAGTLLALVSLSFIPAAAQSYTVTDLGTLGGQTSGALAINTRGQIAGFASLSTGAQHAFFWSEGTGMVDINGLSGGNSYGYGINDSGQVVGSSGLTSFLWANNTGMQDLGTLGGSSSTAYGINNSGQVVGTSLLSGDTQADAFLWTSSGGMQDLGNLGGPGAGAYAMNDAGQVVGYSYLSDGVTLHAFLWTQAAGMQDLGTLGGPNSNAFAIDGTGDVAGAADALTNYVAALSLSGGPFHALGQANAVGLGINASRQIVGYWTSGSKQSGFLWTQTQGLQNLNAFIHPKSPSVSVAYGINKRGQIAGTGSNRHALLLTPTK